MILIADSGSTKTHWCLAERGEVLAEVFTKGMNPFFQTESEMMDQLYNALLPQLPPEAVPSAIWFYGAGCTPEKSVLVRNVLRQAFPDVDRIEVQSDMVGAAHAVCGYQPGIACILGTGSNSCFFDGRQIVDNVSPLGFILGDEGSGAVLGKLMVGALLKNQLTPGLKEEFLSRYELTQADIMDRVYRRPFPNRFLASLSPFLLEHIDDPTVHRLVLDAFRDFFRRNVAQYAHYTQYSVGFVGSVAWYYRKVLSEAARLEGIQLGLVVPDPIRELVKLLAV